MRKVYIGKLGQSDRWDELTLDGMPLAELIKNDNWSGRNVFVRYFISDCPVASLDEAVERYYEVVIGNVSADHCPIYGSEWTGQYDVEETLNVGRHNLLGELFLGIGKYLVLEIWEMEPEIAEKFRQEIEKGNKACILGRVKVNGSKITHN